MPRATLPVPERPVGIPARFDDHLKLLFDLQWLAFQSDLTRVFTLMYGRELNSRPYPEIGISEPHHGLSHHGDRPEQLEKYARLNTWHAELFASLPREAARRRRTAMATCSTTASCCTAAP